MSKSQVIPALNTLELLGLKKSMCVCVCVYRCKYTIVIKIIKLINNHKKRLETGPVFI